MFLVLEFCLQNAAEILKYPTTKNMLIVFSYAEKSFEPCVHSIVVITLLRTAIVVNTRAN